MYYVMRSESPSDQTLISLSNVDGIRGGWMLGVPLSTYMIEVPRPLRLKVNQDMPGDVMLDFYEVPVPIMIKEMAAQLTSLSVNNLEFFDVHIIDEDTGKTYMDYLAFNVVGLTAADTERSIIHPPPENSGTGLDIEELELDDSVSPNLEFCRLNESPSTILLSERIKTALDKQGHTGLEFDAIKDTFRESGDKMPGTLMHGKLTRIQFN